MLVGAAIVTGLGLVLGNEALRPFLGLGGLIALGRRLQHLVDEIEMVAACVLHPQHIVEQQVIAVAWREPLMRKTRRADQHLTQCPDLGVHAVTG